MSATTEQTAWGVEFGGSAVRLIRLTRTERLWRADEYAEAPVANPEAPDLLRAAAGLNGRVGGGVLAAALGDDAVLFRALSLPRVGDEDRDKMVRGQLEVLVPAQAERFAHGWRARPDPDRPGHDRVLLCAARRDVVASTAEACRALASEPYAVVPSILAIAALWVRAGAGADTPVLLIDVAARCTALAAVAGGEVLDCTVIDEGADRWAERADGDLGPWARELRSARDDCLAGVPADRRPASCVLFGRSAAAAGVVERAGEALGLPARLAKPGPSLELAGGVDFPSAAAALGAALCAIEDDTPAISLAASPRAPGARMGRRLTRRWVALAVWLIAAVGATYGLDRLDAWRYGRALQDARARTSRQGPLDRQIQIGGYLESAGPGPLDVLDRIAAQVPPTILLTTWRYDRGDRTADVILGGTVPNEKEFLTMLEKLSEVGEVEWRTGRPDSGKFRFELRLRVGRFARAAKAPPRDQPGKPAASAPSGSAATAPATSPAAGGKP